MFRRKNKNNFYRGNYRQISNPNFNLDNNEQYKNIKEGDIGKDVLKIQNMLTGIFEIHRTIPAIIVDGNFGKETKNAMEKFQELMGISVTGMVDEITLNELEKEYNKSLNSSREEEYNVNMNTKSGLYNSKYDSKIVGIGSSGDNVTELQVYLNKISDKYKMIPKLTVDGKFGEKTKEAVLVFQGLFNLPTDGIVGRYTWTAIFDASEDKIFPVEMEEEEK